MRLNNIASASALGLTLVSTVAAVETHGGIDFEVFWEEGSEAETKPIKTYYETTASVQAATRLHERIEAQGLETDCVAAHPGTDPASLYALKDCLVAQDSEVFWSLLAEDISAADAFWEQVIAESTRPRSEWVAAKAYVRGYFDGALTATGMATWMSSEGADTGYLHGNAEHYYKLTENLSALQQRSHIFEGWGGVESPTLGTYLTNFTVPDFQPRVFGVDEEAYPAAWAINPLFGVLQRAGEKTLSSGSVWGVLHIGVRDVTALESGNGKAGIEVYGAVWYPPWDQSSPENQEEFVNHFLRDEAYQVVSEVVNFSLQALEAQ
jgi:hypothetical protein